MDDRFAPQPVARWYMLAAIASLLFMLAGVAAYVMHVTTDVSTLAPDQRNLFEAEPVWVSAMMGAAAAAGTVGSLLLIMRRKAAEPLLLLSLIATLIWLAGLFAVPQLRDLLSTNDIAVALAVTAITWTIFWFARHSRQRGWLR